MNFQGLQAQFQRLSNESPAWKLLRAENAPVILAYLSELFSDENDVPYSQAHLLLNSVMETCRHQGIWITDTPASSYLHQWRKNGWLREMDNQLTPSDAIETVIRFCQNLEDRAAGTTASHLRIVQEAVRDLLIAIDPDVDERIKSLESKKAEIQREIDDLHAGIVRELSDTEQQERIREVYQLASVLTGDFRRVEDEIKSMSKDLRVQIIEGDNNRGAILLSLMEKEALLANTESGSAFESFFQLLCDQTRSTEFREQIRTLLAQPISEKLKPHQKQFLNQLMRELNKESDRVFSVRRRTEEGLRAYIESGMAAENQAVDRLLSQLEKTAIALRDDGCDLTANTGLSLPVGTPQIRSIDSLQLKQPDEKLDTRGVTAQHNEKTVSTDMLAFLDTVKVREVADKLKQLVTEHGPLTLAKVSELQPITAGIEELVAGLRVAKAINAPISEDTEFITLSDKQGNQLKAKIPCVYLSADLFPKQLDLIAF